MLQGIRKSTARLFAHNNSYRIITQKFYNGQGGYLDLDLTKRTYNIHLETIWEDYCLLEINGLTGIKNLELQEENGRARFRDAQLDAKYEEVLEVKLKIPEDYTLNGVINGSLLHGQGQVGRKLRSNPFSLRIKGNGHKLSLGDVKSQKIEIRNEEGSVEFSGLTVQEGTILASKIESKKLMTSNSINLQAAQISLRSLLMFGPAKGYLKSKVIQLDSISGYSEIEAEGVSIDRYYGGIGSINIKCQEIQRGIGIETGTGSIQFEKEEQSRLYLSKVQLGRMHKGSLKLDGTKIQIE